MKFKIFTTLFLFAASQTAFAGLLSQQPTTCPSVAAIQSAGVSEAFLLGDGWMFVIRGNKFGTDMEWSYVMEGMGFNTHDKAEAMAIANQELTRLRFLSGPEKVEHTGREEWACGYSNNDLNSEPDEENFVLGMAVTPPQDIPPSEFARMIRKYVR